MDVTDLFDEPSAEPAGADAEGRPSPLLKVGDWAYSMIARDTCRVLRHDWDDDDYFYTVQWNDQTQTQNVPESTLKKTTAPVSNAHTRPPPSAITLPPPRVLRVQNVIKGRQLVSVAPTASVLLAAQLIAKNNVGALLVLDGQRLIGIVSERDIVSRLVARGGDVASTPVSAIMTAHPVTVASADPVSTALRRMADGGFRHLPIVDGGTPTGMFSLRDALARA